MRRCTHPQDTLAYANETVWTYARDPVTGRQVHQKRVPEPDYTLRCFVLARVVKQFHHHARFAPAGAALPVGELGRRTRAVLKRSPRPRSDDAGRIVLPGFADLREFGRAHETLLKREAGGAWQSCFQRSHWRMLFPFSRLSQEREARQLAEAVRSDAAPMKCTRLNGAGVSRRLRVTHARVFDWRNLQKVVIAYLLPARTNAPGAGARVPGESIQIALRVSKLIAK
jgi:hypothetical protein